MLGRIVSPSPHQSSPLKGEEVVVPSPLGGEGQDEGEEKPSNDQRQVVRGVQLATVYLGLGSNLGDRKASLRRGLELLGEHVRLLKLSSVYETEPWGFTEQPRFLNMACSGETELSPLNLLAFCKGVEQETGRTPTIRYGPRTLDIDILAYGEQTLTSAELTLPHPSMAERAFVLIPLAEIAPDWVHPVLGKSAAQLLAEVEGKEGVRLWGGRADKRTDGQTGTRRRA